MLQQTGEMLAGMVFGLRPGSVTMNRTADGAATRRDDELENKKHRQHHRDSKAERRRGRGQEE